MQTIGSKIEGKIVARGYQSPGRAKAAIARASLGKRDKQRLLVLVNDWEQEPGALVVSGEPPAASPQRGREPPLPPRGSMTPNAIAAGASHSQVRLTTVFKAYGLLVELAEAEGAPLLDLLGDVQAYEISIRKEVSRREHQGSLEELVGPPYAVPDPSS